MRTTIASLDNWPVRRNGQPIFNSTHEAYLYAQLIWNDPQIIKDLTGYHQDTLANLKYERSRKDRSLNTIMGLACRAGFFRECLEEVQRIIGEPSTV